MQAPQRAAPSRSSSAAAHARPCPAPPPRLPARPGGAAARARHHAIKPATPPTHERRCVGALDEMTPPSAAARRCRHWAAARVTRGPAGEARAEREVRERRRVGRRRGGQARHQLVRAAHRVQRVQRRALGQRHLRLVQRVRPPGRARAVAPSSTGASADGGAQGCLAGRTLGGAAACKRRSTRRTLEQLRASRAARRGSYSRSR